MYAKSLYIIVELKSEQLYGNSTTKYAQPAIRQSIYKEELIYGLCNFARCETIEKYIQSQGE